MYKELLQLNNRENITWLKKKSRQRAQTDILQRLKNSQKTYEKALNINND
jgi:hypothetical protein